MNLKSTYSLFFGILGYFISVQLSAQDKDSQNLFVFKTESGHGFMDSLGNVIVQPEYYFVDEYKDGLAHVEKRDGQNRSYGLIDETGEIIIPLKKHSVNNLGRQMVLIKEDGVETIVNLKSNKSISCEDCILSLKGDLDWIIWHYGKHRGMAHKMDIYDFEGNFLFQLEGKYLKRMYSITQEPRITKPLNYIYLQIENVSQRLHNLYNLKGELLLDSVEGFSDFYDGIGRYRKDSIYVHLDTALNELIGFDRGFKSLLYVSGTNNSNKVYSASTDKFSLLVNSLGEKVHPHQFPPHITWFYDGLGYRNLDTKETFFLNDEGEPIQLDPNLQIDRPFLAKNEKRKWILVRDSSYKFGILDDHLNIRIPVIYDKLHISAYGDIIYFKNDSSGFLDYDGNILQSINQEWVSEIVNGYGLRAVPVYGKTRKEMPCAQFVFSDKESYAVQYVYVDSLGNKIGIETYDWAYPFNGELAKAMKDCEYVFLNKKGEVTKFDGLKVESDMKNGFLLVSDSKEKYGLYHEKDGLVIRCEFDDIEMAQGKLSRQHIYHKIQKTRNLAASQFVPKIENGFVWVKKEKYWGIYTLTGREVLKPEFLSIKMTRDSAFFKVHNPESFVGLYDTTGQIVLEAKYDYISPKSQNGYYRLIQKENYFILTEKGKIISPKL